MAVTSSSNKTSNSFIQTISRDFPQFKFKPGRQANWSPRYKTISFNPGENAKKLKFSVLHELSHALLGHSSYSSDFELLKLESEAWTKAAELAPRYGLKISDDYIQNCLDTYRDWLHRRSTCPACGTHVMQQDSTSYQCYNCQTRWQVSSARFLRPYRKTINNKTR
jgi:ribosomal protein L37AE/L43A